MEDAELCGRRIKACFYEQKQAQNGRPYRPASRHNNTETWTKAGENCLTVSADPKDFVRAAFKFNLTPGGPFPNQLLGDAARRWYVKLKEEAGWKNDGRFSSAYVQELHTNMVSRMLHLMKLSASARRLALKLPASDMVEWMRVLLSGLDPEVMRRHAAEAKRQLSANPALLAALEELGWSKQLEKLKLWQQEN